MSSWGLDHSLAKPRWGSFFLWSNSSPLKCCASVFGLRSKSIWASVRTRSPEEQLPMQGTPSPHCSLDRLTESEREIVLREGREVDSLGETVALIRLWSVEPDVPCENFLGHQFPMADTGPLWPGHSGPQVSSDTTHTLVVCLTPHLRMNINNLLSWLNLPLSIPGERKSALSSHTKWRIISRLSTRAVWGHETASISSLHLHFQMLLLIPLSKRERSTLFKGLEGLEGSLCPPNRAGDVDPSGQWPSTLQHLMCLDIEDHGKGESL